MKTMKNILSVISCLLLCVQTFGQTWNIGNPVATNVIATLEDSTLTISGTGNMSVSQQGAPWQAYSSQITQVVIKEGVTNISKSIFGIYPGYKNLTSVQIPESVTSIGENAFVGTLLYNSQPDGLVYIERWLCGYKGKMPDEAVINILDGTLGIAEAAFYDIPQLTSVIIPEGLTIIGNDAFFDCINLKSITMPESVTSIGFSSFSGCYNLTSIINLRSVPVSISSFVFNGFRKDNSYLYVPVGSKEAYQNPTYGWQDFNIIELPEISKEDIDFTPTTDGATIEWPPYENAEGYKLIIYSDKAQTDTIYIFELDATGNLFNTISFRSASTTLFHTIENLQNDTDYFYTLEILGVGDVVLTSLSGKFTSGNQPTSIDASLTEPAVSVGYYSILGTKLPKAPEKGMYIILYDDGKTEKILK